MASGVYNKGKYSILNGDVDMLTSTIRLILLDGTYVFDDADNFVSDVVAEEVSGTGYTGGYQGAGRKVLSNRAVTEDDTNNRAEFDDTVDTTWTSIDVGTTDGAAVFAEITSDALSPLICWCEFASPAVTNGGDLTIQWDAEGILQLG